MRIALCDDDGRFLAQTARSLENILELRGISAEVAKYRDAEELLSAIEGGEDYDLYLLDIVMPGLGGVELARRLRVTRPSVPILFFTTSRDFAIEAFALGASHYVVKPFTDEMFAAAVDRALALMPKTTTSCVVLKTSDGFVTVPFGKIVYAEADEHYQIVRMSDDTKMVVRMSGQQLWRKLEPSERFVRAGLRYIFNLEHMTGVGRNEVMMTGGCMIQVPRRTMADIKVAYLAYCCR